MVKNVEIISTMVLISIIVSLHELSEFSNVKTILMEVISTEIVLTIIPTNIKVFVLIVVLVPSLRFCILTEFYGKFRHPLSRPHYAGNSFFFKPTPRHTNFFPVGTPCEKHLIPKARLTVFLVIVFFKLL